METPTHFHFTHRRIVEFSDTDLAGIMHFSNFFRFVESAEHAFFRSLGCRVHTSDGHRHEGWPRLEVSCQYRKPARYEQTLEIALRIEEIRNSSLRYGFWIFVADDLLRAPLAVGSCAIIHVELDTASKQLCKSPIPADVRAKFESVITSAPARS